MVRYDFIFIDETKDKELGNFTLYNTGKHKRRVP